MAHCKTPSTVTLVAAALLTLAVSCQAAGSSTLTVDTCSGTREADAPDVYFIGCSDNLTLSDGGITADTKVVISGASSLTLSNVRITAPEIELRLNGSLSLGSGTQLAADSVLIGTVNGQALPTFYASSGATVSIHRADPSPIVSSGGVLMPSSAVPISPAESVSLNDEGADSQSSGGGALGLGFSLFLLLATVWM